MALVRSRFRNIRQMPAVQDALALRRQVRNPQHPFFIRQRPWAIVPFMLAPVLPGETMRNLRFQARAVTDPLKSPIIGWWLEHYFFYCKHRDLTGIEVGGDDAAEVLTSMMTDPTLNTSDLNVGTNAGYYHVTGAPNYMGLVQQAVVRDYFRHEGEAFLPTGVGIQGMPQASIGITNWLDSVDHTDNIQDLDVAIPVGMDDEITAREIQDAMQMWEALRDQGMVSMSYEDFLRSYGVTGVAAEEVHKTELIRFTRNWTYPANTVDPETGVPSSACSWAIAERADKDRFFSEPGWVAGFTVLRPKVYLKNLKASAADWMNDAFSWLPSVLQNDFRTSLRAISEGSGPVTGFDTADNLGYTIDVRDILMYGDQWSNVIDEAGQAQDWGNLIELPATNMQRRYASADMAAKLFADQDVAEPPYTATKQYCWQDGRVDLAIASRQRDVSPTSLMTVSP